MAGDLQRSRIMTSTPRLFRAALEVTLGLVALSACATNGNRATDRPEVALRRSSAWTTYSFALPRVIGPTAELQLKDGVLRGLMSSRAMDVTIAATEANGFGPGGPASLKITERDGAVEVDGLWNGGPVHFTFGPTSVRGSAIVARGRTGARELSCGYQLDRLDPSGAFVGSSGCSGLPQETRLEVSPAVRKMLSPSELAVFLVAALASPPFAPQERL